ncbi:MAG: redoxin domain-containing protein [Bacteroidales bacterium]|nr:redoxin domain-containing protein [Bacteroidales bacterium]
MKNKSLSVLILAFLCPIFVLGQNISITGKTNLPNALVRLLTYDEMFTCRQTKVAETHSDASGNFVLETEIKEITPAQIAVNLERVDIILSPNGKYNLEIIIPDQTDESYFDREQPSLKINTIEDGELFLQYTNIQSFIDGYLYQNFNSIYRGRKMYLLDTLDLQITRNFGKIENKYIKDFIKYRKAAVVMTANAKKTKTEYFDNQKVLYSQSAYMEVFSELFGSYFNSRTFNPKELRNAFNMGYDNFMTYLEKDDFLSFNQQIFELVVMLELQRLYNENSFDKDKILSYIGKIKETSDFMKNRLVAMNVLRNMDELSYNSDAPSFSLKNRLGEIIQLSDYQNDMVLIQFVDHVSPFLKREFSSLNELQKQWGDTIQVVTIATKESFDDFVQMFENQGYKWTLLNLDFNILLLEDYHIKTYPAYVILKRKGRIGMAPAPSPDQYLDYHVRRISNYL